MFLAWTWKCIFQILWCLLLWKCTVVCFHILKRDATSKVYEQFKAFKDWNLGRCSKVFFRSLWGKKQTVLQTKLFICFYEKFQICLKKFIPHAKTLPRAKEQSKKTEVWNSTYFKERQKKSCRRAKQKQNPFFPEQTRECLKIINNRNEATNILRMLASNFKNFHQSWGICCHNSV